MFEKSPVVEQVIGCAISVHSELGPGLLESVYSVCLAYDFAACGLRFERQVPLCVEYRGISLGCGYKIDYIVADEVVVELKSVDALLPVHTAQVLTYARLAQKRHGLLINFNVRSLKEGIRSVLNKAVL